MKTLISRLIYCPIWRRPLYRVTAEGIEARCLSCKETVHVQTWDELLTLRDELRRQQELARTTTEQQ